jgi:hypothetical protein
MGWIWVAMEVKTEDRIDFNGVAAWWWNRVDEGILIRV